MSKRIPGPPVARKPSFSGALESDDLCRLVLEIPSGSASDPIFQLLDFSILRAIPALANFHLKQFSLDISETLAARRYSEPDLWLGEKPKEKY